MERNAVMTNGNEQTMERQFDSMSNDVCAILDLFGLLADAPFSDAVKRLYIGSLTRFYLVSRYGALEFLFLKQSGILKNSHASKSRRMIFLLEQLFFGDPLKSPPAEKIQRCLQPFGFDLPPDQLRMLRAIQILRQRIVKSCRRFSAVNQRVSTARGNSANPRTADEDLLLRQAGFPGEIHQLTVRNLHAVHNAIQYFETLIGFVLTENQWRDDPPVEWMEGGQRVDKKFLFLFNEFLDRPRPS